MPRLQRGVNARDIPEVSSLSGRALHRQVVDHGEHIGNRVGLDAGSILIGLAVDDSNEGDVAIVHQNVRSCVHLWIAKTRARLFA